MENETLEPTIEKCDTCGCTTDMTEFDEMNHWRDCPRLDDDPNGDFTGASDDHDR